MAKARRSRLVVMEAIPVSTTQEDGAKEEVVVAAALRWPVEATAAKAQAITTHLQAAGKAHAGLAELGVVLRVARVSSGHPVAGGATARC